MWPSPTATMSRMIVTLRMTMKLLTVADSLMPMTSTVDIRMTMKTAGRLIHAPVNISPAFVQPAIAAWTLAVVHHCVGEAASCAGNDIPKLLSREAKWPDQPTPTVAAPAAYSRTKSQPMIQATISPMVAYEDVYALPATGTADAISAQHRPRK